MAKDSLINDFTEGKVFGKLVRFATPLFLSNLLQIVYNMMDMIIVGHKLGKPGLSAVSVGGDVSSFLTFLAIGFSNAGQVIISQYIGAKQRDKIARFVGTMFTFLMSVAVLISVVCLFLREPILKAMRTPDEAFAEALNYSSVCMIGMVFIYGYNIVSAVLRGMGDSARPFIFISIAAVMNILLDLLFVLIFDMGSGGAALATVISQAASFILCAVYIIRNRRKYEMEILPREFFRIDSGMLLRLVKLGLPMAVKFASVHLSKLFVNSFVNSFGLAVSAFAGVANKINSTSNLVSNAFNTAGSSMVGQNIAAGRYDRVRRVMLSIFAITLCAATAFTLAFVFFPEQIYGIFSDDAEVVRIGITYLPIAVLIFYGSAARSGMNALINGSGNTIVNFATAIFDGIILRIGLAALFGLALNMGAMGFWLGDALAGFTPLVIGIVFYFSGKWKKNKNVV
ncbi:MAG: MATE family efflux transporter [Oscillospiraceae bacterium]|nr:MATE family efflux transporter [Oscillospiraceae bacterium]